MSSNGKRHIGPVDTIWLNMDRPNNLMVIVMIFFLESVPDWDRVAEVVRDGMIDPYPVFSQRPVPPLIPVGLPSWEDDPDFALERHLHRVTLPAPGDDAALQDFVNERIHLPLDRTHPLWEIFVVEGYGSGAAIVCRFHHALADGIALTRVVLSMTQNADGSPTEDVASSAVVTVPQNHSWVSDLVATTKALARGGIDQVSHLAHPSGVVDALGLGVRTSEVMADLLLGHNPDNVFDGTPGVPKRVVWSRAFPLLELKKLGRVGGATLNDVFLSAMAGALHKYQIEKGFEPVDLVTMVPVNVRPLDQPLPRELGNQFALVFFTFPSETPSAVARLAETKERMDWLKASPEAVLTFGLITAIGRTTRELERYLVDFFANKAIGVTTNVAGPTSARTFAGVPVTGLLGWVPGSGKQSVGMAIVTYAGTVRVGFMVDAKVVPDPQALSRAFEAEMDGLVALGAKAAKAAKPKKVRHAD